MDVFGSGVRNLELRLAIYSQAARLALIGKNMSPACRENDVLRQVTEETSRERYGRFPRTPRTVSEAPRSRTAWVCCIPDIAVLSIRRVEEASPVWHDDAMPFECDVPSVRVVEAQLGWVDRVAGFDLDE